MRLAVLGTGRVGREHARIYAALPGVTLVGVYDVDAAAAASAALACQTAAFASRDALLDAAEAVSVCVPTPQHAEVAGACLEAGLHVLVEKPIAAHPEDARRLHELARRRRRLLQVGHVERFNPAMRAAAAHLHAPRFVECHRLSRFGRRGADVAVVLDLMIHDLDLLLAVIGAEVENIQAAGCAVLSSSTDIANARLQFRNGCVANVTASRISLERMRKIRFFQPDSYVSVDLLREQVAFYRKRADFDARAFQEALERGADSDLQQAIEPVPVAVAHEEPLQVELGEFVQAIRDGRAPLVDAEAAIRALEVACEIERLLGESEA